MKFNILTLFKESIEPYIQSSILQKAIEKNLLEVDLINFRDFSNNKHKKVDDTPYGGGAGMVLQAQPIIDAIKEIKKTQPETYVIFPSPAGKTLNQDKLKELSKKPNITLICGRYEGIDQRAIDLVVDEEISLGEFILCGGELPSLCILEGVSRLLPGVLGNDESILEESYSKEIDGKKSHPVYTKPEVVEGLKVPDVLISGNHKKIKEWKKSNLR